MEHKPLAGLTKSLCLLLKITIVIGIFIVLVGVYNYYIYTNLPADTDILEIVLPSDIVSGVLNLIQLVLLIILGITFLRWIYRTNKNLHALSGEELHYTPSWSVGWFFIPVAHLYKPYKVMEEIWRICHMETKATNPLVGWWWFIVVVGNFFTRLAVRSSMLTEDAAGYISNIKVYIASDGIDLIQYIVTLILVTQIGIAYSNNIAKETVTQDNDLDTLRAGPIS